MRNIFIGGVTITLLVLAFFISKRIDPSNKEMVISEQTPSENTTMEKEGVATENKVPAEKPVVNKKYSYTNSEFNFAVDLPGLVVTRKPETPLYMNAIFTFGVWDQSTIPEDKRVPNTMALYIWNDAEQFRTMMTEGTKLSSEKVNGKDFDVYSFSDENMTTYHYTTEIGRDIYDIGVRNKSDINKFYIVN